MADALVTGSTYNWTLNAKKDGVIWSLSGATVTLLLRKPDGTSVTKSATVTDAAAGVAVYEGVTTDLDLIGGWRRTWRVVQGVIDIKCNSISFSVQAAP